MEYCTTLVSAGNLNVTALYLNAARYLHNFFHTKSLLRYILATMAFTVDQVSVYGEEEREIRHHEAAQGKAKGLRRMKRS